MKIQAVIIDGRHGGTQLVLDYAPTIVLPISHQSQISMGEQSDGWKVGDTVTYHECFRSVDKRMVLYSTTGQGGDIRNIANKIQPNYPIYLF